MGELLIYLVYSTAGFDWPWWDLFSRLSFRQLKMRCSYRWTCSTVQIKRL